MGAAISDTFSTAVSNINVRLLRVEIENCKTSEELRQYINEKRPSMELVYDVLAGFMRVDLLAVINEFCDIRTFLKRKVHYKCDGGNIYLAYNDASLPFMASSQGWVDVVEYLLSLEIDINDFYDQDMNMLHTACYNGKIDVVRVLLAYGADITVKCERYGNATPVMLAVSAKSLACFDELVIHGSSLEGCFQRNKSDITILLRLFDLCALTDHEILQLGKVKSCGNPKMMGYKWYGKFEYLYLINKETMIRDNNSRVLKKYLSLLALNNKWKTFSECKNFFIQKDEDNEELFSDYIIPDMIEEKSFDEIIQELVKNGDISIYYPGES